LVHVRVAARVDAMRRVAVAASQTLPPRIDFRTRRLAAARKARSGPLEYVTTRITNKNPV
jgi:hypothetical protein